MDRSPQTIVLLGPQVLRPTLAKTLAEHGITGPVAVVTAGWQEREDEDSELDDMLEGRMINLRLYARTDAVFRDDRELAKLFRARQEKLREMQDYYRIRLDLALEAVEALDRRGAPEDELDLAIGAVTAIDQKHLERCRAVHDTFAREASPEERPSIIRHREELAAVLWRSSALVIAGGHVATLLNRLKLLLPMTALPIFAWSAGAMAISERVVLFHDHPPQGAGNAEVLDAGLGYVKDVIVLPNARRRLDLSDRTHITRMKQRFAPATCLALDDGEAAKELTALATSKPRAPTKPRPSSIAIRALLAAPSQEAANNFLRSHSFPLIEGSSVTFVWSGEADAVQLRHWIHGLPSSQSLSRLPHTNLWWHVMEIPASSRIEYKLEIVRGGKSEWITDPLNPRLARDPFGANSAVHSAGYEFPTWIRPDPEAREGLIDELKLDRRVLLYLPARFRRSRRYPLLFVHDGLDYIQYTGLTTILDNLMHHREVPDMVVAMANSERRLVEYADDAGHARWLTEVLFPYLEKKFPLYGTPAGRGLMGASFGAVASLSAAFRYPSFYGRLLLQSGSFAFTDIGDRNHRGPLFDPIVAFVNELRARRMPVAEKVFVSCGTYESLIYENRSLVPLLQATGMEVRFVEARDGHNWENWRDRLREGLSWLFPGPLWLVYE